eukprot:gene7154-7955_t
MEEVSVRERSDNERNDEQPTICVLKEGDVTEEEYISYKAEMYLEKVEVYSVLLPVLLEMVADHPLGCPIFSKLFSSIKDLHLKDLHRPIPEYISKFRFLFNPFDEKCSTGNYKLARN